MSDIDFITENISEDDFGDISANEIQPLNRRNTKSGNILFLLISIQVAVLKQGCIRQLT